jgi:formyltetrahydrofolate deformylase
VTGEGANIAEIQMYDRDQASQFAMMLRVHVERGRLKHLQKAMVEIGQLKGLTIRIWTPELRVDRPRLAICVTHRPESAHALLCGIRDGLISAEPAMLISNRDTCRQLAEQFGVPWHEIGDSQGRADDAKMIALLDSSEIDYIVLARYMRILPPESCWIFAGGRIINLHHGLLPGFPGMQPYHSAYSSNMLIYGATCHFIVPELDAGNQIIYQSTFEAPPGVPLEEVIRIGQQENEPHCLVEGVRRVVSGEVQLHFHRVVSTG